MQQAIPARAGIGLRAPHFEAVLQNRPDIGWFEAHSENYFGLGTPRQGEDRSPMLGGKPLWYLEQVRRDYPVSLHGVGMSLGSTDALDRQHLARLKALIDIIQPGLVSEHLSWSSVGGRHFNDLLPLPYTEEALAHMVARVSEVQERLGRQLLIENASAYLAYDNTTMAEWEFLTELAARSDCAILLDINNVYVNAMNHGFDPQRFLQAIPVSRVQEIHLAGHTLKQLEQGELRIDTHDQPVCAEVWSLYQAAVARFGAVPVLIEWDSNLPALDVLLGEAERAEHIMAGRHARIA